MPTQVIYPSWSVVLRTRTGHLRHVPIDQIAIEQVLDGSLQPGVLTGAERREAYRQGLRGGLADKELQRLLKMSGQSISLALREAPDRGVDYRHSPVPYLLTEAAVALPTACESCRRAAPTELVGFPRPPGRRKRVPQPFAVCTRCGDATESQLRTIRARLAPSAKAVAL